MSTLAEASASRHKLKLLYKNFGCASHKVKTQFFSSMPDFTICCSGILNGVWKKSSSETSTDNSGKEDIWGHFDRCHRLSTSDQFCPFLSGVFQDALTEATIWNSRPYCERDDVVQILHQFFHKPVGKV